MGKDESTVAAFNEVLSKIETITSFDDPIEAKGESIELLKETIKKTHLFASLSYNSKFAKFLRHCFEMFFDEPNNLELCVDALLMSDIDALGSTEASFREVIEKLYCMPKYSRLKAINFVKKSKKVSFQDSRNETRLYKRAERANMTRALYRNPDIGEFTPTTRLQNQEPVGLFIPKKMKNDSLIITEEMKNQQKRESSVQRVMNTNTSSVFYPTELPFSLLENVSLPIPLLNYEMKNRLPENMNVNNLTRISLKIPSVENIFKDINLLFKCD